MTQYTNCSIKRASMQRTKDLDEDIYLGWHLSITKKAKYSKISNLVRDFCVDCDDLGFCACLRSRYIMHEDIE